MGAQIHFGHFAQWGYRAGLCTWWLVEVAGALLLVIPQSRFWGAALGVVAWMRRPQRGGG